MELYLWEGKSEWVACCKQIGFYKLGWCAILWVNCCSCPCPFTKRRRAWFERQHHLSSGLRLQSCWMKSCSLWSSVLPSADRYIMAVKIRPVFTGHIMFTVTTFLCMDDFKLADGKCEHKMHDCSCSCPPLQHGASVCEGWPPGALRGDLAGLPLHQHPSAVCIGALLRGRAQTGSLPQAAILSPQTGSGLYCEMEGQCDVLYMFYSKSSS